MNEFKIENFFNQINQRIHDAFTIFGILLFDKEKNRKIKRKCQKIQ